MFDHRYELLGSPMKHPRFISIASIVTLSVIFFQYIYVWGFPTSGSTPWSTKPASSPPSAWYAPNGFLRLDAKVGYDTHYDLQINSSMADRVSCDSTIELSNDYKLCRNEIKLLTRLMENSKAQQTILDTSAASDDEERARYDQAVVILRETFPALAPMAGQRHMVIGDSIDRNWYTQLTHSLPAAYVVRMNPNTRLEEMAEEPEKYYGIQSLIVPIVSSPLEMRDNRHLRNAESVKYNETFRQDPSHFRIDFLFAYGLTFTPQDSDVQRVRIPPWNTFERLDLAVDIWGGADQNRKYSRYSSISLAFALWDLDGWERTDGNRDGLSQESLERYTTKHHEVIQYLWNHYGASTPLIVRPVHNIQPQWKHAGFTGLRMEQMRTCQTRIAHQLNLHVFPFGDLMRGQDFSYLLDGMHPNPAVNKLNMELYLRYAVERD